MDGRKKRKSNIPTITQVENMPSGQREIKFQLNGRKARCLQKKRQKTRERPNTTFLDTNDSGKSKRNRTKINNNTGRGNNSTSTGHTGVVQNKRTGGRKKASGGLGIRIFVALVRRRLPVEGDWLFLRIVSHYWQRGGVRA